MSSVLKGFSCFEGAPGFERGCAPPLLANDEGMKVLVGEAESPKVEDTRRASGSISRFSDTSTAEFIVGSVKGDTDGQVESGVVEEEEKKKKEDCRLCGNCI